MNVIGHAEMAVCQPGQLKFRASVLLADRAEHARSCAFAVRSLRRRPEDNRSRRVLNEYGARRNASRQFSIRTTLQQLPYIPIDGLLPYFRLISEVAADTCRINSLIQCGSAQHQ